MANQENVDVANQEMQLEVEVVCRPVKVGLVNSSICTEAGCSQGPDRETAASAQNGSFAFEAAAVPYLLKGSSTLQWVTVSE